MPTARISRINVSRLYNLGNYEHVRYELTVEVPEGVSAAKTFVGVERIMAGLAPLRFISSEAEIAHDEARIDAMRKMPVAEWERNYGGHKGTPIEVIERYEKDLAEKKEKRKADLARARQARELFDDLGGAEQFTDAKLDWQDSDDV